MKKILFLAMCCLCLVGCGKSWENDFQVSNIDTKLIESTTYSYTNFSGSIKNISNRDCSSAYIEIELKSGNLVVNESIPIYDIKVGEQQNFEYTFLDNYEGYSITVKNVKCYIN